DLRASMAGAAKLQGRSAIVNLDLQNCLLRVHALAEGTQGPGLAGLCRADSRRQGGHRTEDGSLCPGNLTDLRRAARDISASLRTGVRIERDRAVIGHPDRNRKIQALHGAGPFERTAYR